MTRSIALTPTRTPPRPPPLSLHDDSIAESAATIGNGGVNIYDSETELLESNDGSATLTLGAASVDQRFPTSFGTSFGTTNGASAADEQSLVAESTSLESPVQAENLAARSKSRARPDHAATQNELSAESSSVTPPPTMPLDLDHVAEREASDVVSKLVFEFEEKLNIDDDDDGFHRAEVRRFVFSSDFGVHSFCCLCSHCFELCGCRFVGFIV